MQNALFTSMHNKKKRNHIYRKSRKLMTDVHSQNVVRKTNRQLNEQLVDYYIGVTNQLIVAINHGSPRLNSIELCFIDILTVYLQSRAVLQYSKQ